MGHAFGPNEERGIFRSEDGRATWTKILYISRKTGVWDLAMDAHNPRVLYASAWTAERKPWTIVSGSDEGGLYKSTDGGDNWKKLEGGLPTGIVGKQDRRRGLARRLQPCLGSRRGGGGRAVSLR